jgi:hypothetical protein
MSMKISYENIDYNALRLIGEMVSELYEFTDSDANMENMRIATLGEIRGICQMAATMKEVLKG